MAYEQHIETIAKSVVMTDASDLPALVELQQHLKQLEQEALAGHASDVAEGAAAAATIIDDLVMRTIDDVDAAFRLLVEAIETIQLLADSAAPSEAGTEVPDRSPAEPVDGCDDDLLQAWVSNCLLAISDLEALVLAIEAEEVGADTVGALADLRRSLHTIKGECGVLAQHDAQSLFHEAESLVDLFTDEKIAFPADALLALFDWFRMFLGELSEDPSAKPQEIDRLLLALKSAGSSEHAGDSSEAPAEAAPVAPPAALASTEERPADFGNAQFAGAPQALEMSVDSSMGDNLRDFICEANEHIQAAEESLLELESTNDPELINTVFRSFHTIKGVAGFMNLTPIVTLAHNAEYLLDGARTGRITLTSAHLDLTLAACDMLANLLGMLEGGSAVQQEPFDELITHLKNTSQGGDPPSNLRAAVAALCEPSATAPSNEQPDAQAQSGGESASQNEHPGRKRRADQTVKVSTTRMDNLVTMVGELVISQQMVIQDPSIQAVADPRVQRNLAMVWKIIRDLQEVSMSLRMVTLRGTFQKMARLVRDVASKAGKKITFHTDGEDVELDRNVVEEIADPLVHMIRNSCDHGIEPAAERIAAGKPEIGNVTLRAFYSGGSIVIEIEDDGRGLNRDKILKKAVDKGIYTPERDPADIPDSEIYNLIFLPGFSTAEQVTDISGRGVGMDVVRRNIEALRGKIDIRSTPGKGSVFMMRLPLTMAIIDGMVVRVGKQRYVLPTLSIEHSFRPKASEIKTVVGKGEMVSVRGSILPVYRLNRVLQLDEGATDPDDALLLILESNNTRCALMVDEIIGQQQVVIKNLGEGVGSIRGVSGGAILGDGRVALILDVGGIVQQATSAPVALVAA